MRTYTNTTGHESHAFAGGWLALQGITRRDECRAAALAVGVVIDLPDVPTAPSAGMGALDDGGTYYDRARWTVAYRATLAWFDLPWGTVYVPCIICGDLFDTWTCDAEHIVPVEAGGRGVVGNLAIACHACNRGKWARPAHPATVAKFVAVVGGMPTVKRGKPSATNPVDVTFKARERRARGVMTRTRYGA